MKKNGQHKANGTTTLTPAQLEIALKRDAAAYAAGFRECYGLLTVVVNELPTDARLKYIDKLQDLYDRVRQAEKLAGEGK